MSKRILVTGGTGFIGQVLCPRLIALGHSLTVLSRQNEVDVRARCGRVEAVANLSLLKDHPGFDAIINLAGEGIADKRWSDQRKQTLRDSRIALTRDLVAVAKTWASPPDVLVSGSAVGFYGDQGQALVTEATAPHDEFTHRLCRDWEAEALKLEGVGVRVCLSRTGVVAGPGGGFLQRMVLPFRLGLGGRLGTGRQYMPWVHRDDVVAALIFMLATEDASGAYNVVSPNPVTNREFTRCLASAVHRPALFPAPEPVLKLALGEMSRLLLTGQQAIPEKLLQQGFRFSQPELPNALENCVR
ncbi:TIGR01777 family oxidoreductase [Marinobacter sp.]|uniref:TIGR01777 family oxidoreductase n=1 Tax=Marinobacter sp. TaxID=50741 RepID=UPI0034A2B8D2